MTPSTSASRSSLAGLSLACALALAVPSCSGGPAEPPLDPNLPDVSIQDVPEEHISPPVAEVNGVDVYRSTYEQILDFIRGQIDVEGAENVERYLKARDDALERAIDMELLYQEAVRRGYQLKPEEVREEYARRVSGSDSEEAYLASARSHLFTKSEILDGIRREYSVNRYVQGEIAGRLSATDQELRDYYEANPALFTSEKQVRLSSIFVSAPQEATKPQRASALTRISQALARLKAGESFERVAREVSEDEVAHRGGRLGVIRPGFLPRELDEVAFGLNAGEVSGIIETDSGYHLLMVHDIQGGELAPLEKVKDEVRRRVLERKKDQQLRTVVERLRGEAEITRLMG